jgi:hypothetical protein
MLTKCSLNQAIPKRKRGAEEDADANEDTSKAEDNEADADEKATR